MNAETAPPAQSAAGSILSDDSFEVQLALFFVLAVAFVGLLLLLCETDLTCFQRFCLDYLCPCMSTDDGSREHEPLLGAQRHQQRHQLVSWEVDPQGLESQREQQQQQQQQEQQLQPLQEILASACEPVGTHATQVVSDTVPAPSTLDSITEGQRGERL